VLKSIDLKECTLIHMDRALSQSKMYPRISSLNLDSNVIFEREVMSLND
jgi:hypothetical protein